MTDRYERRAARLLRCYPREWRERYGDEFADLLVAAMIDEPRSARRVVDVVRAGTGERFRAAGFGRHHDPIERARAGMGLVHLSLTAWLALGAAIWSQLRGGVRATAASGQSVPAAINASAAVVTVAAAVGVLACAAVLARVAFVLARRARAGTVAGLIRPTIVLVASGVAMSMAGRAADRTSWFTSGGTDLPASGLLHVATLWIRGLVATSAWAHPRSLGHMSAAEIAALVAATIAAATASGALWQFTRRATRSTAEIGFDAKIARAVVAVMVVFGGGATGWVATTFQRPPDLLTSGRTGLVIVVLLGVTTWIAAIGARHLAHATTPEVATR